MVAFNVSAEKVIITVLMTHCMVFPYAYLCLYYCDLFHSIDKPLQRLISGGVENGRPKLDKKS